MKNSILSKVKRALEGSRGHLELPDFPDIEPPVNPLERAAVEIEKTGGKCCIKDSADGIASAVSAYLSELGAERVALYECFPAEELEEKLRGGFTLFRGEPDREAALRADAGITGAYRLIAESGSLVMIDDTPGSRFGSLLPPHHIAVVNHRDIVPDFRSLGTDEGLTACRWAVLISGPSRTADIEQELILGVHGPLTLGVFILAD